MIHFVTIFGLVTHSYTKNAKYMKLANIAILALKGCDLETKRRIASVAGGVSVATVNRWIANNDDNLTKAAVLEILLEKTGLTREQILERDTHGSLSSGHSG